MTLSQASAQKKTRTQFGGLMVYALLEYKPIFVIYWPRSIIMHKKNFAIVITVEIPLDTLTSGWMPCQAWATKVTKRRIDRFNSYVM